MQIQLAQIEYWLEKERERLPLWVPIGLGLGIAIWELSWDTALWPMLATCAGLLVLGLCLPEASRSRAIVVGAAICVAAGYGSLSYHSWQSGQGVLEKVWVGEFYGRIEASEDIAARDKHRLLLNTGGHANLPLRVRVNLSPEQYRDNFRIGAIVRLKARLMPPAMPALPGGYDFARRAWFSEIGATGTALGEVKLHQQTNRSPWLAELRASLSDHILKNLSPGPGSIAAALATGYTGAISEEDTLAMRESGLAHLLSISGLHVTAMVGAAFLLMSRLLALFGWFALRFPVPIFAAAFAAITAVGYTLLTGAEVPTIRSCVAAMLILIALVMGRDVLSLRMVAAGAVFVLIFWPESLAGPSFQMSFAAVTTIIILHERPFMKQLFESTDAGFRRRLFAGSISLLATGLAIELVLSPIALFHFHKTGLYGALVNLVAIPLTTFVIMPFEAVALVFDLIGAGAPFWWIVEQSLAVLLWLAHNVSDLPGAVTMRPEMPVWGFAMMVLGGLWFAVWTTRIRSLGLLPISAGLISLLTAPTPDLLVTGDGKNFAITHSSGKLALLRAGVGDYIRDNLMEAAGTKSEPIAIEEWPGGNCSTDICVIRIQAGQRDWDILATRTPNRVPSMELAAASAKTTSASAW